MRVDILLARYNGENYLSEQIDSILNQKYKNKIFKKNSQAINIISNVFNNIKKMKTEWFDYKAMFFKLLIQKIKCLLRKIV